MFTRKMIKKYRYHLLIVVVGLICLQTLNHLLQLGEQTLVYPDCADYLDSAQKMYHKFTGHPYRAMVIAFITGLPYLFGASDAVIFEWSFYVNVFCWLGTSIIIFEILKNFVRERTAFWFAIAAFFIPGNIIWNFHILTENIFVFFSALAFYLLFQHYKTNKFWYLSLSLAILLSSMLVKPGAKFFAIIVTLFFLREIIKNYKHKSSFLIYGSVLMIVIQVVGMRVQYGDYTISYIDGVTYHNYICSKAECFRHGKEYEQINNPRAEYLFSFGYSEQKKIAAKDLKHQITSNFPNLIKAYFSDFADNTKSANACIDFLVNKENRNNFDAVKTVFINITKWQNRIFTLLGIVLSVFFLLKTYKKPNMLTIISLFIIYIMGTSGISCGQGDRFHLVTVPFTIILFAVCLSGKKLLKPFSEPLQK